MSNKPLVSVCMITYNHGSYIEQAILSVLNQKVSFDLELVIGEDCSSDDTREKCKFLAQKYPHIIRLLENPKQLGMIQNFRRTYAACKGRYVAMLEGDDFWIHPDKLQMQFDYMESNPEIAACFTNLNVLDEFNAGKIYPFYEKGKQPHAVSSLIDILRNNFIATLTVFYRKNLVSSIPEWFNGLKMGDWPLHILFAHHGKLGFMDVVTATYRKHGGGVNSGADNETKFITYLESLKKIEQNLPISSRKVLKKTIYEYLYTLISIQVKKGRPDKAIKTVLKYAFNA
jgi:glycosyltransferase involved in cell wall biosynthesis